MIGLDFCYLFFSKPLYDSQYISIQRVALQIKFSGAIAAYVAMALGLWYFVLKSPRASVYLDAMLLAFVVFGTYNATNYALLKKYRLSLAVMDTVWGMSMFTAASFLYLEFVK
jgi:uncharacterized membrane protein